MIFKASKPAQTQGLCGLLNKNLDSIEYKVHYRKIPQAKAEIEGEGRELVQRLDK